MVRWRRGGGGVQAVAFLRRGFGGGRRRVVTREHGARTAARALAMLLPGRADLRLHVGDMLGRAARRQRLVLFVHEVARGPEPVGSDGGHIR